MSAPSFCIHQDLGFKLIATNVTFTTSISIVAVKYTANFILLDVLSLSNFLLAHTINSARPKTVKTINGVVKNSIESGLEPLLIENIIKKYKISMIIILPPI